MSPHGRISLRNFMMFVATLLVTSFAYTLFASTPVFAADATWDGNKLVYDGRTYSGPINRATVQGLSAIPQEAQIYQSLETIAGTPVQTAHLVYFPGGIAPKSAKEATYIRYTLNPPNDYSDPQGRIATITVDDTGTTPVTDTDENNIDATNTCTIDGIGWLACPVMKAIASGMDKIYSVIDGYLEVRPLDSSPDSPLFRAWSVMRDFANIAFALGFLVIIYSYLTSMGVSNFEVKKLLPRLIIVAVMVNMSFVICAVAVDISNIMGASVDDLFKNIRDSLVGSNNSGDMSWESLLSFALTGGAAVGAAGVSLSLLTVSIAGGAGGLWFIIAPFLLGGLLVLIVTFLILAARQAIITILIILAPLAFVAYILPNTEKWFEKWREIFFTMLVMFPAFSVVFGGAQLAGQVIIRSATTVEQVLLGLAVQIAPLAITPLLLKLGGGLLNRFAGIVNNPSKGLMDRYKNYNKDRLAEHRAKNERINMERFQDGTLGRKNLMRRHARSRYSKQSHREELRKRNEERTQALWHNSGGKYGYSNDLNDPSTMDKKGNTKRGYNDLYGDKQDTELYNRRTEAQHKEHYLNDARTGVNAARRGMMTDATLSEGRGKLYEESMVNADDLTLQSQITGNANLSGIKVQADINKGLSEMHVKELGARGKAALAETVMLDQALKDQVSRTYELEGRASQANELVEDEAKTNWQRTTLNDRTIYTRQLQRQGNAKQLKELQDQWESILVEASAGNTNDYQRRHGPITQDVATSVDTILSAEQGIAAEVFRKERADQIAKVRLNKSLKDDPVLLERAGGIDSEGKAKVLAQLQSEASALHMKNVEAAKSVITNDKRYTNSNLVKVYREGKLADGSDATIIQRHAALQRLLMETGNNYAVQDILDFSHELGVQEMKDASGNVILDASGDPALFDIYGNQLSDDEIDTRRDTQQIINDGYAKSKNKVDWHSGTDRGLAESGRYIAKDRNFNVRPEFAGSELSIALEISKGKVDRERAQKADIDVIDKQAKALAKREVREELIEKEAARQYADNLEAFLKDEYTGMRLEPRNRGSYHVLLKELRAYVNDEPINLIEMENEYTDVVTGNNVQILDLNKISNKPDSKPPAGPITLT